MTKNILLSFQDFLIFLAYYTGLYILENMPGALMFIPPTFIPSDSWTLELFDPHLFGPCLV
jgi:hypothetical protein